MKRTIFEFIRRHFYPSYDEIELDVPETKLDKEDNAKEKRVDIGFERIQRYQDKIIDYDDEEKEAEKSLLNNYQKKYGTINLPISLTMRG